MKIYKKSFDVTCRSAEIPACRRVLSCANQYEQITVWFEHSSDAPKETVVFRMTGEDVPENAKFIGTMLFDNGIFVRHCYQLL